MASWQQAWVEVLPDLSDFRRKANSEITPALGAAGDAGGRAFKTSFGGVLGGSFLGTLGAQFATQIAASIGQGIRAGVDFGLEGVQLASSLGEQVNAVKVQFGDLADEVLALSEDAPRSLNLTRSAFDKLAVRFSSFATTIAKRGGTSAQVIDKLTTRGADFASVLDLDVADALELFQSGLAGQSEPLRAYGINLSEATTKEHAYAAGIAERGAELTEAQKIQARYSSLIEQTNKFEGDLANTRGSLANQQRELNVALLEAQTNFGEALLPTALDLVHFANSDLIPILTEALDDVGPVLAESLKDSLPEIKELLTSAGEALPEAIDFGMAALQIGSDLASNALGDLEFWNQTINGEAEFLGRDWVKLFADGAADAFQGPNGTRLGDALLSLLDHTALRIIPQLVDEHAAKEQAAKLAESYAIAFGTADAWDHALTPVEKLGIGIEAQHQKAIAKLDEFLAQLEAGNAQAAVEAFGIKVGIEGPIKDLGYESGPLGQAFVDGLAAAIRGGQTKVGLAGAAVARAAVTAVRKTFDSHSPSRVMWREGENAIAGLIGGWETDELAPVSIPTVNPSSGMAPAVFDAVRHSSAAAQMMPSELVIVDANGQLIGRMKVEAQGIVRSQLDAMQVEMWAGGDPMSTKR